MADYTAIPPREENAINGLLSLGAIKINGEIVLEKHSNVSHCGAYGATRSFHNILFADVTGYYSNFEPLQGARSEFKKSGFSNKENFQDCKNLSVTSFGVTVFLTTTYRGQKYQVLTHRLSDGNYKFLGVSGYCNLLDFPKGTSLYEAIRKTALKEVREEILICDESGNPILFNCEGDQDTQFGMRIEKQIPIRKVQNPSGLNLSEMIIHEEGRYDAVQAFYDARFGNFQVVFSYDLGEFNENYIHMTSESAFKNGTLQEVLDTRFFMRRCGTTQVFEVVHGDQKEELREVTPSLIGTSELFSVEKQKLADGTILAITRGDVPVGEFAKKKMTW